MMRDVEKPYYHTPPSGASDATMMLNIARIFKEKDAPEWQVAYGPTATRIWREFQRKIMGY